MAAYYNENDPQKAAWMRELIRRGVIAPGEVDERSVEAVQPDDVAEFVQCHWFAGAGVWSYALRLAGWPDDAPVWTGSCPCPSFAASGKRLGFDDPRHLWPAWFRILSVRRPDVCLGEQVATEAGLAWLDVVSADLEAQGYAVGAVDLCAAGVGAPHIRQRTFWVAESRCVGRRGRADGDATARGGEWPLQAEGRSAAGWLGIPHGAGLEGLAGNGDHGNEPGRLDAIANGPVAATGASRRLGDADSGRCEEPHVPVRQSRQVVAAAVERGTGYWSAADWIPCADRKARPVGPGTFPLAHGAPARVLRLRGYGDAIVAQVAQAFIEAYLDVRGAE